MTNRETIQAFVEAINAHNVDDLGLLLSEDHTFIDAHGNQVSGRTRMLAGWRGYFEWFPDYFIEVVDTFAGDVTAEGQSFAMFGFAGGSFKGKAAAHWRLPAAWKAVAREGRIRLWQVFADTKIPLEMIEKG